MFLSSRLSLEKVANILYNSYEKVKAKQRCKKRRLVCALAVDAEGNPNRNKVVASPAF